MKTKREEKRVYLEKLKAYEKRLLSQVKPKNESKKSLRELVPLHSGVGRKSRQ